MKHALYSVSILLLAVTLPGYSQFALESKLNRPRAGDRIVRQEVQYKDPGRPGENVLWDFSRLVPVTRKRLELTRPVEQINPAEGLSRYAREVDDSRNIISYWTDETGSLVASGQGQLYRYNTEGDSLLVWGYDVPTTALRNDRPEVLLTFPFSYRDKVSSWYSGNGIYADRLDITRMGFTLVEADAWGMMILPTGDTLQNVLRVRTLRTVSDSRIPAAGKRMAPEKVPQQSIESVLKQGKNLQETETLSWYAPGYRYPVFEIQRPSGEALAKQQEQRIQEGERLAFIYHPLDQENDYLDKDPANLAALQGQKLKIAKTASLNSSLGRLQASSASPLPSGSSLRYNLYPNPVEGDLKAEIFLPGEKTVELALYSMNGNLLYSNASGKQSGILSLTIPTSRYAKGIYLLHIRYGENTIIEKIIKAK